LVKTSLIFPDWPQPSYVRACVTTRHGGVSHAPYATLNLGDHVGDNPEDVAINRQRLCELAGLPVKPHWLTQVHGTRVATLTPQLADSGVEADAAYSCRRDVVCSVMTADCLPVMFCSLSAHEVAVAHAGWRGLCAGVLENTLATFSSAHHEIIAWLGPAIGASCFEVGEQVREAFIRHDPRAAEAFVARGEKFMADIYQLARLRLEACGVSQIYGGQFCTVTDSDNFFSYRREGTTGRLASLIWLI